MANWFDIQYINEIDSPSLVLYKNRLLSNLELMLDLVDNKPERLMPHIKTNKMPKVLEYYVSHGIKKFKSSTISEAEIAASAGAESVLIAHQLVGPKVNRFGSLIQHFPKTHFYTIIDNIEALKDLNNEAVKRNAIIGFYIDINNGMNRSGVELGQRLDDILLQINSFKSLNFKGLHVYDGHFRDMSFDIRKRKIENAFSDVEALFIRLQKTFPDIQLISGGTPSFTSHLENDNRICSPGTCIFWDFGYHEKLTEQEFQFAVLVIARVISKPTKGIVTIDLGHKAIAAENPINNRVRFLNLDNYILLSQSEEHGVLQVEDDSNLKVGDVLYGVPYHICPTVNLYDEISLIENGNKTDTWQITARKRRITI